MDDSRHPGGGATSYTDASAGFGATYLYRVLTVSGVWIGPPSNRYQVTSLPACL